MFYLDIGIDEHKECESTPQLPFSQDIGISGN